MKANASKRAWSNRSPEPPPQAATRTCDHPECTAAGEYRAPRARDQLNQYYWFCLNHVRAYNASWDFYKGMTASEIEDEIRRSTTWQRQTWPLGAKTGNKHFTFSMHDPLGVFEEEAEEMKKARTRPPSPEEEALRVLGLTEMPSVATLKACYKKLVKKHHPDANGGDKDAEETFKQISLAYKALLDSLTAED
ncbi:J domain-containing protein [Magnetospirillum sulfuroxidans]|nr:J domain-containing protein [Magnetospirillum sulfuroxidans]